MLKLQRSASQVLYGLQGLLFPIPIPCAFFGLSKNPIALFHSRVSPNTDPKVSNHDCNLEESLNSFHRMLRISPLPCVVRFNQLLTQITKMKHYSLVISLDKQMGLVGVKPNVYTLNIVINCFCCLKRMRFGMSVLGKFIKLGCEPDTVTMNTLVKGFLSEGKIDEAKQCYEKLVEEGCKPNVITYSTLLNGFCKMGNVSGAVQLLSNMEKNKSCQPNVFSYNTVIHGLCKDAFSS